MNEAKVLKGQSLLDIAVRDTGRADNALDIASANSMLPTDDLEPGILALPGAGTTDPRTVDLYARRGLQPATGLTAGDMETAPFGGIEFMGIEIDFVVS